MSSQSRISSKFKGNHIIVPNPHQPIATSKFSPESPPSFSFNLLTQPSPTHSRSYNSESSHSLISSNHSKAKNRLTRYFFDVRAVEREPKLAPILPLHIDKRRCTCHEFQDHKKKQHKREIRWIVILVIIILYLLADSFFLNASVVAIRRSHSFIPNSSPTSSTTLSANAQQCISQYILNAPTSPSSYPCSTCLPVLQAIPQNFTYSTAQDGQQVVNAIQFCGLNAVFQDAVEGGQSALSNGGWLTNLRFCAWSGVTCDGIGRVSSL